MAWTETARRDHARRGLLPLPDRDLPLTVDRGKADRAVLPRSARLRRVHDKLRHAGHAGSDAARRAVAKLQRRTVE